MTPQEKAKELVNSYYKEIKYLERAKQCALIAVNEIIDALEKYDDRNDTFELQNMDGDFRYWDKVKQEIEKL